MKGLLLLPLLAILAVSVPVSYGQTISYTQEECNAEAVSRFNADLENYLVICDYPFEIEVNYDTRVIWIDNNVWDGTYKHTITMDDGSFSHESIGATDFFPGAVWNVDGTYTFYDKNNPTLTGYIKLVNNTTSVIISSGVETIAEAVAEPEPTPEYSSVSINDEEYSNNVVTIPHISVTTDKASYSEGETIVITGEVKDLYSGTSISIIVKTPDGNLVSVSTTEVSADKKFSTELTAGGALMKPSGEYTITAQYGTVNRQAIVTFQFGESVTESIPEPTPESLCGAGTYYDTKTNSCKLVTTQTITGSSQVTITPDADSGNSNDDCTKFEYGCYTPGIVAVDFGGKVIFSNIDDGVTFHTFSAGTNSDGPTGEFDTGIIESGSSYEWTADVEGEIPYFCMLHPWMNGMIIVGEDTLPIIPTTSSVVVVTDEVTELKNEVLDLKLENRQLKQEVTTLKGEVQQLEYIIINTLKEIYNWMS